MIKTIKDLNFLYLKARQGILQYEHLDYTIFETLELFPEFCQIYREKKRNYQRHIPADCLRYLWSYCTKWPDQYRIVCKSWNQIASVFLSICKVERLHPPYPFGTNVQRCWIYQGHWIAWYDRNVVALEPETKQRNPMLEKEVSRILHSNLRDDIHLDSLSLRIKITKKHSMKDIATKRILVQDLEYLLHSVHRAENKELQDVDPAECEQCDEISYGKFAFANSFALLEMNRAIFLLNFDLQELSHIEDSYWANHFTLNDIFYVLTSRMKVKVFLISKPSFVLQIIHIPLKTGEEISCICMNERFLCVLTTRGLGHVYELTCPRAAWKKKTSPM